MLNGLTPGSHGLGLHPERLFSRQAVRSLHNLSSTCLREVPSPSVRKVVQCWNQRGASSKLKANTMPPGQICLVNSHLVI